MGTVAVLLTVAAIGCDRDEFSVVACPNLEVGTSTAQPLDTVRVGGLPDELGDTLFVQVLSDTLSGHTVIGRAEDGALLTAPVHPGGSLAGGDVELQIGDGRVVCPSVPFTIEALEPAPGTTAAVVSELQRQLDARLQFLGVTRADLRTDRPDTLAGPMLGLRIAHFLLDDSARRLADAGGAGQEVDPRAALLDALWAKQGVVAEMREHVDSIRSRGTMPPPAAAAAGGPPDHPVAAHGSSGRSGRGGRSVHLASYSQPPPRPAATGAAPNRLMNRWDASPRALSELMWQAFLSDLQTSGSTAEFTDNLETALGLAAAASVVVNPLAAATFAAAGATVVANRIMHEAFANTLPRRFSNMEIEAHPVFFEEDHAGPGGVARILVTAVSEGWRFDATIVSEVMGSVPIPGGKAASKLSNEVMDMITGPIFEITADSTAGNSNIVSIPPQMFGPVDISDREWRRINIIGDAIDPIAGGTVLDYEPRRAGEATLRVATAPNKFGLGDGQYIATEIGIRVGSVVVVVDPPSRFVEPGEVVTLNAQVSNALNPAVEWTVSNGGAVVGQDQVGTNGSQVQVRVPDPLDRPIIVKARSLADRRHLTSAPERSGTATLSPRRLTIRPASGTCLPHGQTLELSVAEMDERDVRWTASDGSVAPDGVFTAPARTGQVRITAASREDPGLRDEIEVGVAEACAAACTFEADVVYDAPASGAGRYHYTGRATINDNHETLRLVADDANWDFAVDISPLDIGGQPETVITRGNDGLGWDRFRVSLEVAENADPGGVSEWKDFETVGETLESVRETGLGLPGRLALRRLRGELNARWAASSGSGASTIRATFDAGQTAYGCGELEKQKEAMEEMIGDIQSDDSDRSKLDRLMGGDNPRNDDG